MPGKTNLFTPILEAFRQIGPRLATSGRTQEEQEVVASILREVNRYCRKEVDGLAIDRRGALGQEMLDAVAERGWFGLTIPEEYGGAGLSMSAATRIATEICKYNGSLATCVALHSGLALYGLIHLASKDLQSRYLPEIAAGQRIAAFCATEPNAGSDIGSMRTLLYEQDGIFRLRGSKSYVTNGGFAGVLTVIASSPGLGGARGGHTMVVIDPSWTGVHKQAEENKLGLKGPSTITIDFDDVEVPRDHVIGEVSKGLDLAHEALTWGRSFMAAGCLGSAMAAVQEAREHIAGRVQFGRTLDQFPLVREQMAAAMADVYTVETVLRLVCDVFDSRSGDIALDSTVAKVLGSERAWNVIDRGLQLMGGAGFIEETGMPRRLRDVRVTRIFEGANDVLRLHLASATLGWPRAGLQEFPEVSPLVPAPLRTEAERFDEMLREVGVCLASIQKQYGFKLFQRQSLQSVMADAIMATYGMMAVLVRAAASVQDQDTPETCVELATAKLACKRLESEARLALQTMTRGADDEALTLANAVLAQ
ncbi:MAG TPA: acyl-CoA dehydrogenase family protein [Polyangiaceae bacterium]|nr:MAG: putative acyl-CoA dehydrogenase [Deltaproteobacteria bacterium ADurb.Bin207]HNZ24314.1 acyl-CoA dehydrogenase family protein [Polyangiaceae bacterium]HOH02374.1 acyl-CoA dehydrogenase family protein [Polyangiaceae bacterium]HPB98394.1 acyl-CoA dehydrogenase family protein [Polyangiaceae bacterium]HPY18542.1 acyl-CoA dehydrogenase family protein [Polyangiaceae bacterium]